MLVLFVRVDVPQRRPHAPSETPHSQEEADYCDVVKDGSLSASTLTRCSRLGDRIEHLSK